RDAHRENRQIPWTPWQRYRGGAIVSRSHEVSAAPASGLAGKSPFRPDIQGLRAVAVMAVVLFHVWPHALPGGYVGVDVFFVISGFLITTLLYRELEQTGAISFQAFYTRRLRRLMPASVAVLVTVLLLTPFFLPAVMWK